MTASDNTPKVPSQIFRWFEKMKANYEQSVQAVLAQFEQFTREQQTRIDKSNQAHIDDLKTCQQQQQQQSQAHIQQLQKEIGYYQQQIAQQQQQISELNDRYDSIVSVLLTNKNNHQIKDIFTSQTFLTENDDDLFNPIKIKAQPKSTKESVTSANSENLANRDTVQSNSEAENLYQQALSYRDNQQHDCAHELFVLASELNHAKAMGALGRCYFLGEGVEKHPEQGLVWLIKAAELNLPQAVSRVEQYKENDPQLFDKAIALYHEQSGQTITANVS